MTVTSSANKRLMKVPQDAYYATGRRKEASARVWIFKGKGKVVVNNREIENYFARPILRMIINQPFVATKNSDSFDVYCTVEGSGPSGQSQAIRHGISRALAQYDESLKSTLRTHGFITRDPRAVERKKYGQKKARKSFQFSKR